MTVLETFFFEIIHRPQCTYKFFLATAPALAGPWKVLKPLSFLDIKPPYKPVYVENPVVNKLTPSLGEGYVCLVDLSEVTGFAISYSANGLDWTPQLREVHRPQCTYKFF